ncbi:putative aldo keto reductase protein [Botrytis fragariae]|uniref:Putative aldo keto reductase protein n=1 Tax=Botrytis fragariae TaxID=1964551 RepID=A0A8H6EE36_9HELO|nr:putative aldo keto reductase protein [Botrytis fragariae]KAF5868801.1 putative aldo keto reductase protein [Botrytis fragariae]
MPILAGKEISQNGLGLMRMTWRGAHTPDSVSFPVLKAALAAGVNVWNGADFYGSAENNSLHLLARYFAAYPEDAEKVVLCIKSGFADRKTFTMDSSPEAVYKYVENANKILGGRKHIDLFGMARQDKITPIEDTVKALDECVAKGLIGGIQLSEVSANSIRRASAVAKIGMLEAEISLWATDVFENGVAEACGELGIVMVAHTPLGAGMLTGQFKSLDDLPESDPHRHFPRFQPENFHKNLELVEELGKLALGKGCTPAQLALCWIKSQSKKPGYPPIVPVFGARSESRVKENTTEVELTDLDLDKINEILASFPVQGRRYPAATASLCEY